MKPRLAILLLLVLPFTSQVSAAPQTDVKLIEITQTRIASLYRYHDHKSPLPNTGSNPFRPEDRALSSELPVDGASIKSTPVMGDAALLQQAVKEIRISGVINMGNQLQIVANQLIYKEGAVIQVHLGTTTVLVRVMTITQNTVTFRLGEAELSVRI